MNSARTCLAIELWDVFDREIGRSFALIQQFSDPREGNPAYQIGCVLLIDEANVKNIRSSGNQKVEESDQEKKTVSVVPSIVSHKLMELAKY